MALRLIILFAVLFLAVNALIVSLCIAFGKNFYAAHGKKLLAGFSLLLGSVIVLYLSLALLAFS
jgi:hypothetical protein